MFKTKILLMGSFLPEGLELSYEKAFRELSCEVRRFELNFVSRFLIPYYEYIMNKKIFDSLNTFNPDLILVMKGHSLWPRTIRKIKELKRGSLIFCFNSDNPFNLVYFGASNRNILKSIPYYDCYFIWARSLVSKLKNTGINKVDYLPFGFDPDLHYPINPVSREKTLYYNDLVFIGNWDKEREGWLKHLKDFDLGIWGGDYWRWRCRDKDLRRLWRKKAIYGEEMSKVLNSSKISLNILRLQNKGSINMRTFELPACKVFVLAERSLEAKEFFQEDKEAVYFSTPEELRDKAKYYLRHEEERNKIAQAGYRRCVTSGYSYLERAKKILEVYKEMKINL